jgi:hypothetical protein
MMAELTVIRWRDIPAQVTAREGRTSARVQLSERFQEAIDEAALRAGLFGTDDYLAEWRRDVRPCGDDLEAEVQAEAQRLEADHPDDVLDGLARAGGLGDGEERGGR